MRDKPASCETCGAEAEARRQCPRCGSSEWVIEHRGHYKWGREVFECDCPSPHSAMGRRLTEAQARQQERGSTGKRTAGRPARANPVTTPEMARKAAEGLARGLPAKTALREAGFPPSTVNLSRGGINRMIRAELMTLGRKYIEIGRQLTPTSVVERQNLNMRMGIRRFTRLTNAFSKKFENHCHHVAIYFTFYNFCRVHQTLRVTPAMEAGITDHVWSLEELVRLLDQRTVGAAA